MTRTALLFAGQATQYVGMGRGLCEAYPEAREIFDRADEALQEPLSRLIFEGPKAALDRTENTQPAVLTVACAAWAVLQRRGFVPAVVAGHSLGEYAALVAAGALGFEDALRLCRRRGTHMQAAVPEGVGAMAAILRAEDDAVAAACEAATESGHGVCQPAAFNAPRLTVISGDRAAVEAASAALQAAGAAVTPLAVSAPFHCSLLAPAADRLRVDLARVVIEPLRCPYVPNTDACWVEASEPEAIRDRLVRQVTSAVRWRESIALMLSRGVERVWHVGPGRSNLTHVKRQARRLPVDTLDEAPALARIVAELEGAS